MSVRTLHPIETNTLYFVTFTCCEWKPLFELANAYQAVYRWFDYLHSRSVRVVAYVIMPNHVHVLLYFPVKCGTLTMWMANGKRFMAYEIIKLLIKADQQSLLKSLASAVPSRSKKKGQLHRVFEESFDAKECCSDAFTRQKIDYIHFNPVRGKWQLVEDWQQYPHSSAGFYMNNGCLGYDKLLHWGELKYG